MTVVFMLHYVTYSGYNNYLTAHFFVKAFSEILLNGEWFYGTFVHVRESQMCQIIFGRCL